MRFLTGLATLAAISSSYVSGFSLSVSAFSGCTSAGQQTYQLDPNVPGCHAVTNKGSLFWTKDL